MLRRVAALTVLSGLGIALLSPLTARSALPDAVTDVEPLLVGLPAPAAAAAVSPLERGFLTDRGTVSVLALAVEAPVASAEILSSAALPTPPSAPMEATLHPIAP